MAAIAKPIAFSFSKKAEPKRVVGALAKEKKIEGEAIKGLEAGQVTVDAPREASKKLTIVCKNPLEPTQRKGTPKDTSASLNKQIQDLDVEPRGGLLTKNLSKLSEEDAEATRELLKDLARSDDDAALLDVKPILMREGSKRIRETTAPEASRDMFERVPVEAFGEALLRGMGFDPAKHSTKPVWYDKPRDNLLGLGAKALLPHEKAKTKAKAGGAQGASSIAGETLAQTASPGETAAVELAPSPPASARDGAGAISDGPQTKHRRTGDQKVWPTRGLVVRVIGRRPPAREIYGAEAVVLEVDQATGCCRIKARVSGKSQVVPGVKMVDLETRVSRDCKEVRVVKGSHP